mgnify:CR=1 FL=1
MHNSSKNSLKNLIQHYVKYKSPTSMTWTYSSQNNYKFKSKGTWNKNLMLNLNKIYKEIVNPFKKKMEVKGSFWVCITLLKLSVIFLLRKLVKVKLIKNKVWVIFMTFLVVKKSIMLFWENLFGIRGIVMQVLGGI